MQIFPLILLNRYFENLATLTLGSYTLGHRFAFEYVNCTGVSFTRYYWKNSKKRGKRSRERIIEISNFVFFDKIVVLPLSLPPPPPPPSPPPPLLLPPPLHPPPPLPTPPPLFILLLFFPLILLLFLHFIFLFLLPFIFFHYLNIFSFGSKSRARCFQPTHTKYPHFLFWTCLPFDLLVLIMFGKVQFRC